MAEGKRTVRTSVLLPQDAHAQVQALANASDVSAAWVIRHAVLRFLEEHSAEPALPFRIGREKGRAAV